MGGAEEFAWETAHTPRTQWTMGGEEAAWVGPVRREGAGQHESALVDMWRTTTEGLSWDSPEKAERLWWVQIGSVLGVLGWAAEANVRQGPNRREVVVGLMEVVAAARMAGTVDAWEARLTDDGSPGDIVWRMTDGTDALFQDTIGPSSYGKAQGKPVKVWGMGH